MEFKISLTRSAKPQQQKIVLTPAGKHDCYKPEMVNERFGVSTEFMNKLEKTYDEAIKKGQCGHEATLAMAALVKPSFRKAKMSEPELPAAAISAARRAM